MVNSFQHQKLKGKLIEKWRQGWKPFTTKTMDTWLKENLKACQETTACREATKANAEKTEPDPGMMQSVRKHQEVPKEDAAVMPVGGLRKRCRDQNLATGRRQKPKERIQASRESRKKLTVTGRKVHSRAREALSERTALWPSLSKQPREQWCSGRI
jgi:hypothetical protein